MLILHWRYCNRRMHGQLWLGALYFVVWRVWKWYVSSFHLFSRPASELKAPAVRLEYLNRVILVENMTC